jgi:hypothetical protein
MSRINLSKAGIHASRYKIAIVACDCAIATAPTSRAGFGATRVCGNAGPQQRGYSYMGLLQRWAELHWHYTHNHHWHVQRQSSGGHQAWHTRVSFFSHSRNEIVSLYDAIKDAVINPQFVVSAPATIKVELQSNHPKTEFLYYITRRLR